MHDREAVAAQPLELVAINDVVLAARGVGQARLGVVAGGCALTHFIVAADVERSATYYSEVEPTIVALANSFLNIRVADIQTIYRTWSERGAQFLTPPIDRGPETRCYLRDPDGHLIEIGQSNSVDS
jgi:catechol 2,3-dioxygenase-like lactoylglutathione lyase family enzyme